MSDVLYHQIVRPCGVYRSGTISEDAREIAWRVRRGEVRRQVLEGCGCIRCMYALELLDKEMRPFLREAGAQVKCRMCGCEFRLRSRRQRRCPDCGAVEMWFTLKETWHCVDCGKDFQLDPDAPLCEQVPDHIYGSDDLRLRHPTLDDLEDDREAPIKEGM